MDQECVTNMEVQEFTYLWTINNFNNILKSKLNLDETITSSTFTEGKNNKLEWVLKLNKKIYSNHGYGLDLFLNLKSSDKPKILAKYKFSIINGQSEEAFKYEQDSPCLFEKGDQVCNRIISLSSISDEPNDLLSDGKLKICCKISVMGDITKSKIQIPECRLADDFGTIFETKKFCDAILTVADGKAIPVHKNILAARSPVFAAMFEHEMEERKHNRVNITDINYETLHELLKFIYTGKADNIETMAGELLVAADKYALERLKLLCEKELYTNLSIENAAELLQLADLHGANQLKFQAIHFIHKNPEVIDTMEWKQLKETSPRLLADVYEELVISKMFLVGLSSN